MTDDFVPIEGFEGEYSVNRYGDVRSESRILYYRDGRTRKLRSRIMSQHNGTNGYKQVYLSRDGKNHMRMVHRLVALAFLPNPEGLPEVNHKDERKTNNAVENLEWCTTKYNANYGTSIRRRIRTRRDKGQRVLQFTKTGDFITEYASIADACEAVNGNAAFISRCLYKKPRCPSAYGFVWRFKGEVA